MSQSIYVRALSIYRFFVHLLKERHTDKSYNVVTFIESNLYMRVREAHYCSQGCLEFL